MVLPQRGGGSGDGGGGGGGDAAVVVLPPHEDVAHICQPVYVVDPSDNHSNRCEYPPFVKPVVPALSALPLYAIFVAPYFVSVSYVGSVLKLSSRQLTAPVPWK